MTSRICIILMLLVAPVQARAAENVVLITIDGIRWQELFRGLDARLAEHPDYSARSEELVSAFWRESVTARRGLIMPFVYGVMTAQGVMVGDRDQGSCARMSNDWNFSYPGYNEILSGVTNDSIDSNAKVPNPEKTVLELLQQNPAFAGRAAAFGSWDVFPYIYHVERSGIPVNIGLTLDPDSDFERFLNTLQQDISPHWPTVRHDAFTHHYALSTLREQQPRLVHIAYGEPDDFAHDGKYDEYVFASRRVDGFIEEVWQTLQSLEQYRDNTALFVTVDHGRGEMPLETWQHHASKRAVEQYMTSLATYENGIEGSDAIWMAAMGPGVPAHGAIAPDECLSATGIAATLMHWLGEDYQRYNAQMAPPMKEFLP
ncbi:hypothetical protein PHACT_11890 [Pseudohongiella acticola]|uniref:Phosphoglyceromutase n=1 Tax=Pseudohongiella acticola TaxID=1524254 RepID=A0A1E8CMR7_9GAMM|nr:alkaline phosphatase family protein [Pseudohongiella acticola]OFE13749.1 hypothetical protein PHACT_11890 [Pseudohongiella acticola]